MTLAVPRPSPTWPTADRAEAVRVAQRRALAAHERYRRLRAAARVAAPAPPGRCRVLARIVLGTGAGLAVLVLGFAAAAYAGWSPLLIVPPAAALYAVVDVTRRSRACRAPRVEELARASGEAAAAMAAARRAQQRARAADRGGGRHRPRAA